MSKRFAMVTLGRCLSLSWLCWACSSNSNTERSPEASGAAGELGCLASDGDEYAPGMTKESDTGAVHFELLSSTPAPPALSDNVFVMAVTSEAGERKSGALSVALDMPQHGHSSPKQPEIAFDPATEAFTLEPLRLFMVGLWRLTFTFEADAEKPPSNAPKPESAVFRFCVQ